MTSVHRLKAISAVVAVAVFLILSQDWGDSTSPKTKARENLLASRGGPASQPTGRSDDELVPSKFSRQHVVTFQTRDGNTLFALQVKLKLDPMPARPRDLLIMIDTSASQFGGPLNDARLLTKELVKATGKDDRIAIWTVNIPAATRDLTNGFQAPTMPAVGNALKLLDRELPSGNTDLPNGLEKAIASFKPKAGRQQVFLFLGDGMSHHHLLEAGERVRLCQKMVNKEIAFFPVPLGPQLDPKNLHGLASGTGGLAIRVMPSDRLAGALKRIQTTLTVPILYPQEFQLHDAVREHFPTKLPPLRGDAPTLVVGRIKPTQELAYSVAGTVAGQPARQQITEAMPESEIDHFFLVSLVNQWKKSEMPDAPALIRADRALAFAQEQNRHARDEWLAQAQQALAKDQLDAAGKLFDAAGKLDPNNIEAQAGAKTVEMLRKGLLTKQRLEENTNKPANADLTQVVAEAIRQSRRLLPIDPDAAHLLLKRTFAGVHETVNLLPNTRQTLLSLLEDALRTVDTEGISIQAGQQEQARIRSNALRHLDLKDARWKKLEQTRRQMLAFSDLMNRGRLEYAWPEAAAIQADAIALGQPMLLSQGMSNQHQLLSLRDGFARSDGGLQGQVGDLGGQYRLQGGDQIAPLIRVIRELISQGDWLPISGF